MESMRNILERIMARQTPEGKTYKEAACEALVKKAMDGNLRAFITMCKILGEDPNKMEKEEPDFGPTQIIIHPVTTLAKKQEMSENVIESCQEDDTQATEKRSRFYS